MTAVSTAIVLFATRAAGASTIQVGDGAALQQAIVQANDGDVIELAGGTYSSPVGGFAIDDLGKGFTIRATAGATVVLDGGGARDIVRFINSCLTRGRPVTFEGLTFRSGFSETAGIAGAVTLQRAEATFRNCTFEGNQANVSRAASTGGGGTIVAVGSRAFFSNCSWSGNSSGNYGGALAVETGSAAFIHASQFVGNRTNLPGHLQTAPGGAIHVGNSVLRVSNSRFEGNQAGYVGGALYAIGLWSDPAGSDVLVTNSTFVDNLAQRDPSVSFPFPTEGGAIHLEDLATARIYNSRFLTNRAFDGGAVNLYRAIVEIHDSVFQGNRASGGEPENFKGLGGAISAISNDANDASTDSGSINRRSAKVSVYRSLVEGSPSTSGDVGGCLFAAGDANRVYGQNGVSQDGTAAENRAAVTLGDVVFHECTAAQNSLSGSGIGGAIALDLADLDMQGSLVIDSHASGPDSSGGGLAIFDQSSARIVGTTIARNTADRFGAGVFAQGSEIQISNSNLVENELSPGVAETIAESFGAAIFTAPDDGHGLPVTGFLEDSVVGKNVGLPIYDDDRTNGPVNAVHYDGNAIFSTTFGPSVYSDALPGFIGLDVAGLNAAVVSRSNGTSTDKSIRANSAPSSAPAVGALVAAPPTILPTNAAGDGAPPTASFLGYAWSGATSATLNGVALSQTGGVEQAPGPGAQTLAVGGGPQVTVQVAAGVIPAVSFTANPATASRDTGSTLSWSVTAGTQLDAAVDQGVTIVPASGSVTVMPAVTTTYDFYLLAEEGGTIASATVTAEGGQILSSIGEQPVSGKALVLGVKPGRPARSTLAAQSSDRAISLGRGYRSADDPVLNGGDLRVMSVPGGFDSDYRLTGKWRYIGKPGANKGYKWNGGADPIRGVVVRPHKLIRVSGKGAGLGHHLDDDPNPVDVLLTIGGHRYWMRYGGSTNFRKNRRYRAARAPAPGGCLP